MTYRYRVYLTACLFFTLQTLIQNGLFAQGKILRPGFDKGEYEELMRIHTPVYDSTKTDTSGSRPKFKMPKPTRFKLIYRSPVMGLDNKWDLWKTDENLAAINVRGTTTHAVSWLENFYAAMVPAAGELKLANDFTFKYRLAENPKAAVHIGWLIGTAFLARDMVPQIDSLYKAGIRDILLMGHSQGGAICFVLTAHLYSLQKQGILPRDIRFKSYCSAGPKVGNTYFAYEYENLIAGGWGVNVVNAADWVPEVPFSVQTLDDFNNTNPFRNIDGIARKQKLIARIAIRHAYRKMRNPSFKARKNYIRYLGGYASKAVQKSLPEFQAPVYANTSHYVRISPTVILLPDKAYYDKFPDSDKDIFIHHLPEPYLFLLSRSKY